VLAIGEELLQIRSQAGALGRVGGEDVVECSSYKKSFTIFVG